MALKDWSEIKQEGFILRKEWKKGNKTVTVQPLSKGWDFFTATGNNITSEKKFNSKSQAINAAKNYMRTH